MEDDDQKPEKGYPISSAKLSKTPSWIMLGFVLGAVFVAALPPLRKKPEPPPTATLRAVDPPKPTGPREPPQVMTIEAVFAEWGKHAIWSDDVTEVALWNSNDKGFTDFFEVRRYGGTYYFRTIPELTRRVFTRGKPLPESPLQFTESEEQYRDWQKYGRAERPQETQTRPKFTRPSVDPSTTVTAPVVNTPKVEPMRPPKIEMVQPSPQEPKK